MLLSDLIWAYVRFVALCVVVILFRLACKHVLLEHVLLIVKEVPLDHDQRSSQTFVELSL